MNDAARIRKLNWLCRRGMKELDILLSRFVQRHEQELVQGAWPGLEELLQFEDDVLWDCVQDPALAAAGPHRHLLSRIRGGSSGAD